ncbi:MULTISPECIES: hypothetical protein [Pseudoalteromonas]|uniref:Uncharacterized protein n=1 Tax=Pseudoalteromonas amylolytica TaxID=1859457 RepID=A0A1S1MSA4_9GAMM|nr:MULTISPECIES: hypothetical protein [Pseudoalteromonas]OHU86525.1 hypothetical protein BFC16_13490 [Pseudoalteromonas sp. JW3]OHU88951.1 hypothetical protein BET10_19270 [Pseudoalteromonas amylolytica]
MKKTYLVIAGLVAAVLLWFLSGEKKNLETEPYSKPKNDMNVPIVGQFPGTVTQPKTQVSAKPEATVHTSRQLSEAAQHVAIQYEQTLKYPPYSQPLTEHDEDRLNPNHFYPVTSMVEGSEQPLSVKLSKYRYVYPEDILIEVTGPNLKQVELKLVDIDTQREYASTTLQTSPFEGRFKGEKQFPRALQLVANVKLENQKIPVVVQFQYMQPSAKIVSVTDVYPQNENMIIELNLAVSNPGIYRLRANLFTSDGQPLAHLVSKEKLSKGSQSMMLKAHWSVLRPNTANMLLSGFVIERMSPSPAEPASYGNSEIKTFEIKDFAFDSLQQLPYNASSEEQQSLEFLRQLARDGNL